MLRNLSAVLVAATARQHQPLIISMTLGNFCGEEDQHLLSEVSSWRLFAYFGSLLVGRQPQTRNLLYNCMVGFVTSIQRILNPQVTHHPGTRHTGGFTNDVMGISNLLYVAQMSERVPILPPFAGFRDSWEAGTPLSLG